MQTILLVSGIIIIFLIGLGGLIYLLIPNQEESGDRIEGDGRALSDNNYAMEQTTVIDVQFKGYSRNFTYAVMQSDIKRGQYVLVLTQDGIRCAKVVSEPRVVNLNQLPFPPFLLQTIICVADNADLEYYQ